MSLVLKYNGTIYVFQLNISFSLDLINYLCILVSGYIQKLLVTKLEKIACNFYTLKAVIFIIFQYNNINLK